MCPSSTSRLRSVPRLEIQGATSTPLLLRGSKLPRPASLLSAIGKIPESFFSRNPSISFPSLLLMVLRYLPRIHQTLDANRQNQESCLTFALLILSTACPLTAASGTSPLPPPGCAFHAELWHDFAAWLDPT